MLRRPPCLDCGLIRGNLAAPTHKEQMSAVRVERAANTAIQAAGESGCESTSADLESHVLSHALQIKARQLDLYLHGWCLHLQKIQVS